MQFNLIIQTVIINRKTNKTMETKENILSQIFRIKCSINDLLPEAEKVSVEVFNADWAKERKQLHRKTKSVFELTRFQYDMELTKMQNAANAAIDNGIAEMEQAEIDGRCDAGNIEVEKAEKTIPTRSSLEEDITELSENVFEYANGHGTWGREQIDNLIEVLADKSIDDLIAMLDELEGQMEEIWDKARKHNAMVNAPVMSDPETQIDETELDKMEVTPQGIKMHELTRAEFDDINAEIAKIKETQKAIAINFFENIAHIVRNEIGKDWVMTHKSHKQITFSLCHNDHAVDGADFSIKRRDRVENRYVYDLGKIRQHVPSQIFVRFYSNFAMLIQEDEVMSQIADLWEAYMTSWNNLNEEALGLNNSIC